MNGHHGNFFETSTGRLPLDDGSDWRETLGKHISDDPRHFIFRRPTKKVDVLKNFERPFTPRGWLRSASNFGTTRFRRSPTFHVSTLETFFNMIFFDQTCIFLVEKAYASFWRMKADVPGFIRS